MFAGVEWILSRGQMIASKLEAMSDTVDQEVLYHGLICFSHRSIPLIELQLIVFIAVIDLSLSKNDCYW